MTGNFGHFFVYAPGDKAETREYGTSASKLPTPCKMWRWVDIFGC